MAAPCDESSLASSLWKMSTFTLKNISPQSVDYMNRDMALFTTAVLSAAASNMRWQSTELALLMVSNSCRPVSEVPGQPLRLGAISLNKEVASI